MSTLLAPWGTAKPTYGQNYCLYANDSAWGMQVTMPAGGPWVIESVGGWFAGDSTHASATNSFTACWASNGTLLSNSNGFTPTSRAFALGNSDSYTKALQNPPTVAGSTAVIIGFGYTGTTGHGLQSSFDNTAGSQSTRASNTEPGSYTGHSVSPGTGGRNRVWLYYHLANTTPNAPTLNSPGNGSSANNRTPTFNWTPSDPDGDPATSYQLQVSSDPAFGSTVWDYNPNGSWANGVAVNTGYGGPTLNWGTTYYWRVRTWDSVSIGWGPFCSAWSYTPVNYAPYAPTLTSPADGAVLTTATPTLQFTCSDPEGDPATSYDYEVAIDGGFGGLVDYGTVGGSWANGSTISRTAGGSIGRGGHYYWRARTFDSQSGSSGPWSSARQFYVNALPTVSLTDPASSGIVAHLTYPPSCGWTTPRLNVAWNYHDDQGQPQAAYQVVVTQSTDKNGVSPAFTPFYDSGSVGGAAGSLVIPSNLTQGTYYKVYVAVSDGYETTYSSTYEVRAVWAVSTHLKDVRVTGVAPTYLALSNLLSSYTGTSSVTLEWNSGHDGQNVNHAVWKTSIADVTKDFYLYYRVWLLTWGSATPTNPYLDSITVDIKGLVLQPDRWNPGTIGSVNAIIETGDKYVGSQCLRINGNGSSNTVYQDVPIDPNTNYILQSRIKSVGNSGAKVTITANGSIIATAGPVTSDQTWAQFVSPPFSTTATTIRVSCTVTGASLTAGLFDAVKVERGTVASSWVPGMVGDPVVVDAGGLSVDASAQGIFRLRGSAGGAADRVDLGVHGLSFGGAGHEIYGDGSALYAPPLTITPQDGVNEGGQITLRPAGSHATQWNIDVYNEQLRLFDSAVRMTINNTSPQVAVTGDLFVSGQVQIGSTLLNQGSWELYDPNNPFIDWKTNVSHDYDYRMIYNLGGSGLMDYYGTSRFQGNVYASYGLSVGGRVSGKTPTVQGWNSPGDYTWTKPADCLYVVFEVWGGGGAGGGAVTNASGAHSKGGGGGGGGYTRYIVAADSLPASFAVHVGGGGGAVSGGSGNAGGQSYVNTGSWLWANGGGGGFSTGTNTSNFGAYAGAGGSAGGGHIVATGQSGTFGWGAAALAAGGTGGSGALGGGGGNASAALSQPSSSAGGAGSALGGGGGGACVTGTGAAQAGGAGGPGAVYVWEFYGP